MLEVDTIMVHSSVLDDLDNFSPSTLGAAARAINRTADRARTQADRRIREEVAFPASYLSPAQGRLSVTRRATPGAGADDLEAIITGRHRPTSLARFVVGSPQPGQKRRTPLKVMVNPGHVVELERAFPVRLRSGNTDTKNNIGIAIRLPEGQVPDRAYKPTKLGRGLWLLYGPSIDQIFDDVAEDIGPETADFLGEEFLRQVNLGGLA